MNQANWANLANLRRLIIVIFLLCLTLVVAEPARAEAVWYPLPAEAYRFGEYYPEAQQLLYAFDYGHAMVYERLILNKGNISDPEAFEKKILAEIIGILKNPPHVKSDEADIAPTYVFTFPLVVDLFDWSHLLHQFVFDILATSTDRGPKMIERINQLYRTYQANKSVMITDQCKTMLFMDGQYFSKAFRRTFPSFNLLIWSYHWFQIRLYEDLMLPTRKERDRAVAETIKKFWQMISNLPDSADFDDMPETAKVAPTFARFFPRIPAAFDNNHMLHDVVSDILVSDRVPLSDVRAEALKQGRNAMNKDAFRSTHCPY